MEPSTEGRCGEIASDLSIILVTVAQLIFFTRYHRYIAWPVKEADGSVTRLSMLADGYSSWLPFVVAASIVVIVASIFIIVYNRDWFRQAAWILFPLMGIMVTVSLLLIFPFDFSVIPDAKVAEAAPVVVRVFFVLAALFYATSALVYSVRFVKKYAAKREVG